MRGRLIHRLVLASSALFVLLAPGVARAQVQVTPAISITPSKTVTPWVYQMAIATAILAALVVVGLLVSYLRYAPAFFGRKEAPPQPPGTRPPLLVQAPAAGRAPAGSTRTAAASAGAVAVAERPAPQVAAPAPATPAPAPVAAQTSAQPTAAPMSEPAVQADAVGEAEEAAPEETAAQAAEVETPAVEVETPTAEPEAPTAEPEAPAASAQAPVPPATQPAGGSHAAALDQETFDRVLEEQLAKGVDRRVAEGRARAAAVVAARKKAQG